MFTHAAADVRCESYPGVHVGVLRDISEHGMFIYSDFKPTIGTKLRITLRSTFGNASDAGVYCEGIVVRVEQVRVGAAPGIAIRLDHQITSRLLSPFVHQYQSVRSIQDRLTA